MERLWVWLAPTATMIVLGIAPVLTADAASARLPESALTAATVRPGGSVTVTLTEDYAAPESSCAAFLDGQPLPDVPPCDQTFETPGATSGGSTDATNPTVVTTFHVTVTVPLATAAGQHELLVRADKARALRVLQVTYPVVPKVLGLLYSRATAVARAAGLTLCAGPKGLVVEQEPQPGSRLSPAICLAVVARPAATVPNLLGKDLATARSMLKDSDLVLREPRSAAGVVSAQQPAPRTVVLTGSTVSVTMRATVTPAAVAPHVGDGLWPLALRIGGTGGTFVLGIAAGLVVARLRRPPRGREPDDPAPAVRLRPRPDTGLDVGLFQPTPHGPHVDVRLEPHDDEPVDPVLLEVSS